MKHFTQTHGEPVLLPEILAQQTTADSAILTLQIPEHLAYFAGHFDQVPIVPGVVQIQWAVYYARQYLGLNREFRYMEAIKFKELLLSGHPLELNLRYNRPTGKLEFCYRSADAEFSSGRLYFDDQSD